MWNVILTFAGLFALAACTYVDEPSGSRTSFGGGAPATDARITSSELDRAFSQAGATTTGASRALGSGQFFDPGFLRNNPDGLAEVVPSGDRTVEINLLQASIPAAAEAVIGGILERPYTIAEGVSGRVTLQTTGPVQIAALLELFTQALETSGARLERDGEALRIVPGNAPRGRLQAVGSGDLNANAIIVAPLKFISATEAAELLSSVVGPTLSVTVDNARNHLMFSGTSNDIAAAVETLNVFDIDVMKGKSTAIVPLRSAEPDAVRDELDVLFDSGPGGALEGVVRFLPNPRLKAILVISTQSAYISRAENWIRDLDRTAGSARRYAETYPLSNRSALDFAPILAELLASQGAQTAETEPGAETAALPADSEAIQIVADNERNTIIARAFRAEHDEIARLVRDLDRRPKQVLLEATIAEVTLSDEISLGVRWFFESGNFSASFSDLATGGVASTFPGFSAVFASGGDRVALSALAAVTDVKVVASPTLMVLNNQEAELRIGDQVPVATRTAQSTTDPDAPVVSTIEYRDTGVILRVQPRIGAGNQIVLDIEQETSDVVATTTSGIDSPTIRQRSVSTNVVVQNGATLALGGIIQERGSTVNTKVPGLGDVPVVGAAFRSKREEIDRTELLILIRPVVISTPEEAKRATDYWRGKLKGPNTAINSGLATEPHSLENLFQ